MINWLARKQFYSMYNLDDGKGMHMKSLPKSEKTYLPIWVGINY